MAAVRVRGLLQFSRLSKVLVHARTVDWSVFGSFGLAQSGMLTGASHSTLPAAIISLAKNNQRKLIDETDSSHYCQQLELNILETESCRSGRSSWYKFILSQIGAKRRSNPRVDRSVIMASIVYDFCVVYLQIFKSASHATWKTTTTARKKCQFWNESSIPFGFQWRNELQHTVQTLSTCHWEEVKTTGKTHPFPWLYNKYFVLGAELINHLSWIQNLRLARLWSESLFVFLFASYTIIILSPKSRARPRTLFTIPRWLRSIVAHGTEFRLIQSSRLQSSSSAAITELHMVGSLTLPPIFPQDYPFYRV